MPIDRPSDLPDDERPPTENPSRAADEWRAAEDSQEPSGRRPSPTEQAADQPEPSPDERPGTRSQPSPDAPAADNERLNSGEQRADDERRAPDTQPVDEARPDASTAANEAPDPPEAPAAEPRTRQEHADTDPRETISENEAPAHSADAWSRESQSDPQLDYPPTTQQQSDGRATDDAVSPADLEGKNHGSRTAKGESERPEAQPWQSSPEADLETDIGQLSDAEPQAGEEVHETHYRGTNPRPFFNHDPTLDANSAVDADKKDGDSQDRYPTPAKDATSSKLTRLVTDENGWTTLSK